MSLTMSRHTSIKSISQLSPLLREHVELNKLVCSMDIYSLRHNTLISI